MKSSHAIKHLLGYRLWTLGNQARYLFCGSHYTILKPSEDWDLDKPGVMIYELQCVMIHCDIKTTTSFDFYQLIYFLCCTAVYTDDNQVLCGLFSLEDKRERRRRNSRLSLTRAQSPTAAAAQRDLCPTAGSWCRQRGAPTERERMGDSVTVVTTGSTPNTVSSGDTQLFIVIFL